MSLSPEERAEFERLVAEALPDRVVAQWVVIGETYGSDGANLEIVASPDMTPWRLQGMLAYVRDMVTYTMYPSEGDDESYDDD